MACTKLLNGLVQTCDLFSKEVIETSEYLDQLIPVGFEENSVNSQWFLCFPDLIYSISPCPPDYGYH